jgi:1-acyl-sn-glycerol-3-phosphate acyltransferase
MIRQICTLLFKTTGWKYVNNVPSEVRSFVFLGAPHTSNHDFIPTMAISYLMNRNSKFVIKNDWLRFPFGLFMKSLGAVGIDRNAIKKVKNHSMTDVMANLFKEFPELVLMIAPEGTRSPNENWKSGFYYIAQKANVPIVLGYADYAKKEAGMGLVLYPSNYEEDMKTIMKFYERVQPKKPENFRLDKNFFNP